MKAQDKLLSAIFPSLEKSSIELQEQKNVFAKNYFEIYEDHVSRIKSYHKVSSRNVRTYFIEQLQMLEQALRIDPSEGLNADSTILNLMFFPLMTNKSLHNKSYSDFNIDCEFFESIHDSNLISTLAPNLPAIGVSNYEIKDNKLSCFTLYNYTYNISYKYDANYTQKSVIFSDSTEVELN